MAKSQHQVQEDALNVKGLLYDPLVLLKVKPQNYYFIKKNSYLNLSHFS